MRVDDVGKRPQLVDGFKRAAAFDPHFQSDEEKQSGTEKDDVVNGGLDGLDQLDPRPLAIIDTSASFRMFTSCFAAGFLHGPADARGNFLRVRIGVDHTDEWLVF